MSHSEDAKPSTSPRQPRTWGILAQYEDVGSLLAAAAEVRDAGYKNWDCHTPFPVHGLDRAMGMKKTILPWIVLAAGLSGVAVALLMQWYVNSPHTATAVTGIFSGYPLVFSGKPYWSLPANVPVIFELTVLFASITAFVCVWALNGLPRFYHPAFTSLRFRRATDDKFFIIIEARDPKFSATKTADLLLATATSAIEEIKD
jgi:hypothetical protein